MAFPFILVIGLPVINVQEEGVCGKKLIVGKGRGL